MAGLSGFTVALMVAGGFAQEQYVELQRALMKTGARVKTISTDNGLTQGWMDNTFGHSFPVDAVLGDVLAADLDAVFIPGGARSATKLAGNMHAARILRHMIDAEKPVVLFSEAAQLLAAASRSADGNPAMMIAEAATPETVTAALDHAAQFIVTEESVKKAAA